MTLKENMSGLVYVEPGKPAVYLPAPVTNETVYKLLKTDAYTTIEMADRKACVCCDVNADQHDMPPNREVRVAIPGQQAQAYLKNLPGSFYQQDGSDKVLVSGPFVILGSCGGGIGTPKHVCGLSTSLKDKYLQLFAKPQEFFSIGGRTYAYGGNRKWVDTVFTNVVADMVKSGYVICTPTFGGHSGEIAKVDLYKGDRLVRVRLEGFSDHKGMNGNDYDLSGMELTVEVWDYMEHGLGVAPNYQTLWGSYFSEFTIEESVRFYQIENRIGYRPHWWGSRNQAIESIQKHAGRAKTKYRKDYRWEPSPEHEQAAAKAIVRLVQKFPGYKGLKEREVGGIHKYRTKPYGSNHYESDWTCTVRGKQFNYDSSSVTIGGQAYGKNGEGQWVKCGYR